VLASGDACRTSEIRTACSQSWPLKTLVLVAGGPARETLLDAFCKLLIAALKEEDTDLGRAGLIAAAGHAAAERLIVRCIALLNSTAPTSTENEQQWRVLTRLAEMCDDHPAAWWAAASLAFDCDAAMQPQDLSGEAGANAQLQTVWSARLATFCLPHLLKSGPQGVSSHESKSSSKVPPAHATRPSNATGCCTTLRQKKLLHLHISALLDTLAYRRLWCTPPR